MPSPRSALRPAALALLACVGPVLPAAAQQFTTAEEVRPMLDFTRDDWVSLREFDGDDHLIFTHILAWRCGIDRIGYAVNGAERERLAVEPCYEGETRPNAFKDKDILPYVAFASGSVETVTVWLTYDDGTTDKEEYGRKAILSR